MSGVTIIRCLKIARTFWSAGTLLALALVPTVARSNPRIMADSGISLSPPQCRTLARLVQTDPDARALFAKVKKTAADALSDTPDPIKVIQTEGKLDRDPAKDQTKQSLRDMEKLAALGWTAIIDQADGQSLLKDPYAAKARQFILAWAVTNQPTGDPIDETNLGPLFVAYDQTRPVFSAPERQIVDNWLRSIATIELQKGPLKKTTYKNNWNSHRLKIVGLIGYLLADPGLEAQTVQGFHRQVAVNLEADGSSFDFHARDALRYHCFDLEPLLTLAICARQHGLDFYDYKSPSGASLARAVQFLIPFCDGTKTHAEFVHSDVAFDQKRAASGQAAFDAGRLFDPRRALAALSLAAAFDPAAGALERRISGQPGARFASWQDVLNAASVNGDPQRAKQ